MPVRKRDSDVTRAQILEVARELFVSAGHEAVTVREVARRVGISHGTIYLYYRDKDDLLLQVCEEQFAKLLTSLRRLPRTRTPRERLRDALALLAAFGIDNPHEYYLMMGIHATVAQRATQADWGPMAERVSNHIQDLVSAVVGEVVTGGEKARRVAWALAASVTGLIMFCHADNVEREAARLLTELQLDMLFDGLQSAVKLAQVPVEELT